MARRKKPENETNEQAASRRRLESIANHATRSEKTSWERKRNNIEALVEKLQPIEEQILELMNEKIPILDDIFVLRAEMVESCIHPIDLLVEVVDTDSEGQERTYVRCKFCERKINTQS